MAKLKEHIELIKETLQSYMPTDDFNIDDEIILGVMNVIRAALIRQDKHKIDSSMYQIVDCLKVECIERTCSIAGYTVKTDGIKRIKLPPLVKNMAPYDIRYLGGSDLETNGTRLSVEGFVNFKYTRYTKELFHYLLLDDGCYLRNTPSINNEEVKLLTGVLLLDNPIDACNWTDDTTYPCPSDYRLQVLTIQHILSGYNIYPDEYNDAREQLRTLNLNKSQQPQNYVKDEQ